MSTATAICKVGTKRSHRRRPIGRPTAYRRAFCKDVVALGEQGASLTQMAVGIGITRATLYRWMESHSDFGDAVMFAREVSLAWWESQGQQALWSGKSFNTSIFSLMMRNMFPEDYGSQRDSNHSSEGQATTILISGDDADL